MPGLSSAEHRQAQRESRAARNALARRWLRTYAQSVAYCEALGATTRTAEGNGQLWYIVTVPRFTRCPGYGRSLPEAVAALEANVANFCDHGCTKGPGGADIRPLCEARRRFLEALGR